MRFSLKTLFCKKDSRFTPHSSPAISDTEYLQGREVAGPNHLLSHPCVRDPYTEYPKCFQIPSQNRDCSDLMINKEPHYLTNLFLD